MTPETQRRIQQATIAMSECLDGRGLDVADGITAAAMLLAALIIQNYGAGEDRAHALEATCKLFALQAQRERKLS